MIQNLEINYKITSLLKRNGYPEDTIKTVIALYNQPTTKQQKMLMSKHFG